jgi:propionyl-CoA carboxylase alpha chain
VTTTVRRALRDAAASLAAAVGYAGAGTAEFLLTDSGEFWFLEFNTRLQVEHPVTELLHGVDLVALQLDIAQGLPLPPCPPASGHAIQARLYAEDPAAGYRPSAGLVHRFAVPGVDVAFGLPAAVPAAPVLRLDSGTEPGTVISEHYDALLGKVITWAPGRAEAIRRLSAALSGSRIHGPASNRDLLVAVLNDPVFRAGHATTALLSGYDLTALAPAEQCCDLSALAAAVADAAANRRDATVAASVAAGWRNVAAHPQRKIFDGPRGRVEVDYQWTRTGGIVPAGITRPTANAAEDGADPVAPDPAVVEFTPEQVTIELAGVRYRFDVARAGAVIFVDSAFGAVQLALRDRLPPPASQTEPGSLAAPMPGSVIRVLATTGDRVLAGQPLIVIEAMKMEHQVTAPAAGLLTELRVAAGAQVQAGDVLAILTDPDPQRRPPEPEREQPR